VFFFYRIAGRLAVGAPWWGFLISRAPAGIFLKRGPAFPPTHPTTKMCLSLMLRALEGRSCRNLVDVGCGSGVLALAGLKLGVGRAVAVDICDQALAASRANAELNGLDRRLMLVRGSTEAITGAFDLVIANLPMPVLADKLPELVRLAAPAAAIVVSGFQDLDRESLEAALRRHGLGSRHWLSKEYSFFGPPPSGSYTWMALLACGSPGDGRERRDRSTGESPRLSTRDAVGPRPAG
jgi:ribosomal protein L11 methylase PrmA